MPLFTPFPWGTSFPLVGVSVPDPPAPAWERAVSDLKET